VNNPTGADLLSWFVDRLRSSEDVRRDLPLFGTSEDQTALLERVRDIFLREWTPQVMKQFVADLDSKSQPRTRLNLPWGATPDILPPEGTDTRVKWASPRRPEIAAAGNEIHVIAAGRRWRFAKAAGPILERLASGNAYSIVELNENDAPTTRAFVRELVANGLVVVV
jgi:hypothetical protein